ncbi:MAG: glycosyltransferase family 2 protein [Microscillaceae bacterium]|nr:glycosyltransferase family 2 protein [Microscillaceae bacterium]
MLIFALILSLYLGINVSYYALFSLAGLFYRRNKSQIPDKIHKIAILIPAYKEDQVICDTVANVLQQNYPREMFEVVVIADSLQAKTLEALKSYPARILEVFFEKSTKAKALNKAMELLPAGFDLVLILDADNHLEADFLQKINIAYSEGYLVIQAHRTAKNLNTRFARLDAVSEEINNHIFRKGHQVLGLSSALIGSGMALEYQLHKNYLAQIQALGGFDKELELRLLKDGVFIKYLQEAWVYDEKVQNPEVFERQRTRWIAAQIRYGMKYFLPAFKELIFKGNIDYFNKALQFVLLPRLILLGLLGVLAVLSPWLGYYWMGIWFTLFLVNILTLFIGIPLRLLNKDIFISLLSLPLAFYKMVLSTLKFSKANKSFLHTPHSSLNTHK